MAFTDLFGLGAGRPIVNQAQQALGAGQFVPGASESALNQAARTNPAVPGVVSQGLRVSDSASTFQAYETLLKILQGQGATSPLLFNQELAQISAGGQQTANATRGELARGGLQNAGLSQALMAAIGQGTQGQLATRRAQETQIQEQRMRDDLQLFLDLIIGPAAGVKGISAQEEAAKKNRTTQLIGALLGGAGTAAGGFFGGPVGAAAGGAVGGAAADAITRS